MKFVVKIVLIVFLVFLSTPTIVSLIEKSTDTSFFFDLSEEEEEEESQKEFKADFKFYSALEFVDFSIDTSNLILSESLSKHDNISATIFVTPPEQV